MNIDILLVAEGTYPYVRGGVSSWIHQLIGGLKEYSFAILFLGSKKEDYSEKKYEFPDNVLFFEEYFLFDAIDVKEPKSRKIKKRDMQKIYDFHTKMKMQKDFELKNFIDKDFLSNRVTIDDFLYSQQSWDFIQQKYMQNCFDVPFIDYFWTVRSIHRPVWLLAKIASRMNFAKVVHSPSTGYAGFLSALIHTFYNIPFILTEHGIYIRERKIDIHSSSNFSLYLSSLQRNIKSSDYLQQMWINFFEKIGFLTYKNATDILSLFQAAKELQIGFGADKNRCEVIPNGVDIERLNRLVQKREEPVSRVITLLGRVVPIKDIKTFIRAVRIVKDRFSDVEGWIVGPVDEDRVYAKECEMMVTSMHLESNIRFLGFQKVDDIFPKTKILTLTSISEGMPLVILEGFAAGIPCVATDVGSCKELIYGGLNSEDVKTGKAGEITAVGDAQKLAHFYIKLLSDETLWKRYQKNALKRVSKFYTQELFFQNYKRIYQKALSWQG